MDCNNLDCVNPEEEGVASSDEEEWDGGRRGPDVEWREMRGKLSPTSRWCWFTIYSWQHASMSWSIRIYNTFSFWRLISLSFCSQKYQRDSNTIQFRKWRCQVVSFTPQLVVSFFISLREGQKLVKTRWQTSATNVIMHPLTQLNWGHIRTCTVKKSQTNATSVILNPLGQALW